MVVTSDIDNLKFPLKSGQNRFVTGYFARRSGGRHSLRGRDPATSGPVTMIADFFAWWEERLTTEGTEYHREETGSLTLHGLCGLCGEAFIGVAVPSRCLLDGRDLFH